MVYSWPLTLVGVALVLGNFYALRKIRSSEASIIMLLFLVLGVYLAAVGLGIASPQILIPGNSTSTTTSS